MGRTIFRILRRVEDNVYAAFIMYVVIYLSVVGTVFFVEFLIGAASAS